MLRWILALLLIPLLDAALLGVAALYFDGFGILAMVAFVVLTGLLGMLFVRAEGRRTIRKLQRSLAAGEPPTNELLDGALLIAAGAFLLTPGFVTDLLGVALVFPLTRIPIRAGVKRFVVVPYLDSKTDGLASGKVWTFGFPQGDVAGGGGGAGGGFGPSAGGGARGSAGDDTVDLGAHEYSVEGDDKDGYTIDFGGTTTSDRDVSDEDDDR